MANATSEVVWIRNLLISFGLTVQTAAIHCDSEAALHIANNLVFHECTKHIEVDSHFVRERILSRVICPRYIPMIEQLDDIFTKALGQRQFRYRLSKLALRTSTAYLRGSIRISARIRMSSLLICLVF